MQYRILSSAVYLLWFSGSLWTTDAAGYEEEPSVEQIFRHALSAWRSSGGSNWEPWSDFSKSILDHFQDETGLERRLELVGGLEEGILAIERATIHQGEDRQRDDALSMLYFGYAAALLDMSQEECVELALDPHTLLIGAETASRDQPSTELCTENAENSLRNAVTLNANNVEAERLLQTLTGSDNTVHKRKPKEFVAELFDSFAESFDEKLKSLEYKVPGLIGQKAEALAPTYRAALDAGCGTGLAGRFLRPLVTGLMVGVDASQKMLDIAAKCTKTSGCGLLGEEETNGRADGDNPLYDGLLVLDLDDMTLENTLYSPKVNKADADIKGFDLVVAADVFVYFGKLDHVLQTFAKLSTPGAKLIFSCERATNEEAPLGWRLLSTGRFAHTKTHAIDAASKAGYSLVTYEEIVPRIEKGEPVLGHLFGFVLGDHSQDEL